MMGILDYILIIIIGIAVFFALFSMWKKRKNGGCMGCSGENCVYCKKKEKEKY
ncbi:MAG: FeoB-associated Cys-rich membrane protein [Lachnospiraceae bacterium]|nr:FeoB-associated Cys-rich membrane protein [Lachnospiraceae bacterium]MDY5776086.1 FeoB-associated Cys-rich membrane protein [Lachnospiraceae bacterium]